MNISMRAEGLADAMMQANSATKAGENKDENRYRQVGQADEKIQQPPLPLLCPVHPGQFTVSVLLISFSLVLEKDTVMAPPYQYSQNMLEPLFLFEPDLPTSQGSAF